MGAGAAEEEEEAAAAGAAAARCLAASLSQGGQHAIAVTKRWLNELDGSMEDLCSDYTRYYPGSGPLFKETHSFLLHGAEQSS